MGTSINTGNRTLSTLLRTQCCQRFARFEHHCIQSAKLFGTDSAFNSPCRIPSDVASGCSLVEIRMRTTTKLFICHMAPTHRIMQKQMKTVDVPDAPEWAHRSSMGGGGVQALIQVTLG